VLLNAFLSDVNSSAFLFEYSTTCPFTFGSVTGSPYRRPTKSSLLVPSDVELQLDYTPKEKAEAITYLYFP